MNAAYYRAQAEMWRAKGKVLLAAHCASVAQRLEQSEKLKPRPVAKKGRR